MKKLSLLFAIIVITFVSGNVIVRAQSTDTLDDPDSSSSSTLDADSDSEVDTDATDTATAQAEAATVPDTGFAPAQNKVLTSSMVFMGGAALGGAVGFGIIQLRKKSQN